MAEKTTSGSSSCFPRDHADKEAGVCNTSKLSQWRSEGIFMLGLDVKQVVGLVMES